MGVLEETKNEFVRTCNKAALDLDEPVRIRPLSSGDAIGDARDDFVLKKGKEYVIEAVFETGRGQAFTGEPRRWDGSLREVLSLHLSNVGQRGVVVAAMNAVLRHLGLAAGTIHCRDEDPVNCGAQIADRLARRFGCKRFGLVGLQPAILEALVERFSPRAVRVVDLNPDNIGSTKYRVEVWNGQTDLSRLAEWCEVGLATGSSIVNGTIDEIIRCFADNGRPLAFFGNTISGAAALLNLDRLCPFGR